MTKQSSSFFQRAIEMVKRIPDGQVSTYGQISRLMSGSVRGARAVGYALAGLSEEEAQVIPWWRVINAQGRISNSRQEHRAIIQRKLLEEEGIKFDEDESIDLSSFGWQGPDEVMA